MKVYSASITCQLEDWERKIRIMLNMLRYSHAHRALKWSPRFQGSKEQFLHCILLCLHVHEVCSHVLHCFNCWSSPLPTLFKMLFLLKKTWPPCNLYSWLSSTGRKVLECCLFSISASVILWWFFALWKKGSNLHFSKLFTPGWTYLHHRERCTD